MEVARGVAEGLHAKANLEKANRLDLQLRAKVGFLLFCFRPLSLPFRSPFNLRIPKWPTVSSSKIESPWKTPRGCPFFSLPTCIW